MVKYLPAVWETWAQSMGWEDPLEKGITTNYSNSSLENSMDRGTWQATIHGIPKTNMTGQLALLPLSLLFKIKSLFSWARSWLGDLAAASPFLGHWTKLMLCWFQHTQTHMKNEPLPPGRQRVSARLGGSTGLNSVTVSSLGFPDLPAMQEIPVWFLGQEDLLEKDTPQVFLGFPCDSAGKEFTCNAGDLGLTPVLGRSPREGKGYPLQYSVLENSMDYTVDGLQRVGHDWVTFTFTFNKQMFRIWWLQGWILSHI